MAASSVNQTSVFHQGLVPSLNGPSKHLALRVGFAPFEEPFGLLLHGFIAFGLAAQHGLGACIIQLGVSA